MTNAVLQSVDLGELSVAYRSTGTDPPLVLLHGFLCDSRVWRTQLDDLSDAFTVVAWDAPGAGASSEPPEEFTIADWARCLADFLDAVGIGRAHVLGLSWGGMLAQELYRLDATRIETLVLADTYAGWKGSLGEEAAEQRLARCVRDSHLSAAEFVARWVPEMFSDSASAAVLDELATIFADFHPHGFRLMAKSLAETDTTDLLSTIEAPTLLLWGDADRRSPLSVAEQFRQAIPGAELEVIPDAGHVSNMEQPEEFSAHVRRFCRSPKA